MIETSKNVKFLEKMWQVLNERYFESSLSKPVITIQSSPKTYGHFTCDKVWKTETDKIGQYEINISAEYLNRTFDQIAATMVHEMVHEYCRENNVQDTSRGNVYHNKKFKEEAEKRGIVITYDKKIGWSVTEPTQDLIDLIEKNFAIDELLSYRQHFESTLTKKKKSSTRKYVCPCCGMSVRATKTVNVMCNDCGEVMVCEEKDED